MALWWTMCFIIQGLLPFTLADASNEHVRVWLQYNMKESNPAALHRQGVKHCIVELYQAVFTRISQQLEAVKKRRLPAFSLQIDLWTCKTSGQKYLGKII